MNDCILPDILIQQRLEEEKNERLHRHMEELQGHQEKILSNNSNVTSCSDSSSLNSLPTGSSSGGSFSELRPLAAANIGRLIAGKPSGMVHELLPFFTQEGNERHLVKFYLFQTLKQVSRIRRRSHTLLLPLKYFPSSSSVDPYKSG